MEEAKNKVRSTLVPWLSARESCKEGRFIQVGNSLLLSKEFQKLHSGSQFTYFAMCMEAGISRYFTFPLGAAKKYGISGKSFRRYVAELEEKGFIKKQSGMNQRKPNRYSFSFGWKPEEDKGTTVDYNEYMESDAWANKRFERLKKDNFQCQMCGSAKNLNVHHVTYERLGNEDMNDLVTLCNKCHSKVHSKDKKRIGSK